MNITKKQHYIPQVYLRGFSPEYLTSSTNQIEKDKCTIFFYNLAKKKESEKSVPIKSLCFEEELYEVMDENGNIIWQNYIEKYFSELERMFGEYRTKLNKKVFVEENYKTKCFLDTKEKVFWRTYIILQILRLPEVIKSAEEILTKITEKQLSQYQIRNTARIVCLPFFEEIEPESQSAFVIELFSKQLENMTLAIGVDKRGRIITSDNPVFICTEETSPKEFKRIIFPISSQICLFLFRRENEIEAYRNCCFEINERFRKEIVKAISLMAFNQIYSNHLLDKFEKKCIKEIMMERKKKGGE